MEYLANGVYTKTSCSYIELENAIVLGNLDNIDQIERFEQDYTTIKLIKYDDTWFNYKIELRNEYENRFSFIPERVYQSMDL